MRRKKKKSQTRLVVRVVPSAKFCTDGFVQGGESGFHLCFPLLITSLVPYYYPSMKTQVPPRAPCHRAECMWGFWFWHTHPGVVLCIEAARCSVGVHTCASMHRVSFCLVWLAPVPCVLGVSGLASLAGREITCILPVWYPARNVFSQGYKGTSFTWRTPSCGEL